MELCQGHPLTRRCGMGTDVGGGGRGLAWTSDPVSFHSPSSARCFLVLC